VGWDYEFRIDLNTQEQSVVSQFTQLVTNMSGNIIFGDLIRLNVLSYKKYLEHRGSYRDAQVEYWSIQETPDVALGLERVQQLPTKYPGKEYLFEALWAVKRYNWSRKSESQIDDRFVVRLSAFDEGFLVYPGCRSGWSPGIIYEVRDSKYYLPSVNEEVGTKNMETLITELSFFANYGATNIYGLNNEVDNNPLTHKLSYHHTPLGFLDDLRRAYPEKEYPQTITKETIKKVANECDKIWLRRPASTGLMIVSKRGAIGSIKGFYETLSNAVEVK
jgi:hypothetical protein